MSSISTDTDEVFVYTGPGGERVPKDVVRVRVDPSVTSIPASAFCQRKKLAEVELCEGLVEIGDDSFGGSLHSITKINIPNSFPLFGVRFVSTMTLNVSEKAHLRTASSPTLGSRPS
jgi:hypothetical protein